MATKKVIKKSTPKKAVIKKKPTAVKKVAPAKPVVAAPKIEVINPNIFPIGKLKRPEEFTETVINKLIQDIRILPEHLKKVSKKIKHKKQLQYSYRDGGWTIEQIIHHTADSHMNAFIRFKLALTENNPTIKPYNQDLWTETADVQLPVKVAIRLLKALHAKWTILLENMDKNDFKRTYTHPEYKTTSTLQDALALYAWHGKHHVAQIEVALRNEPKKEKKADKKNYKK
ncbi:MAG TPA: putative metal-dependent hydrolase [Chitinophagales bacterium]|nr:putative metal-dependent hydrolase [Chitinophagales bacterium]